MAGGVKFCGREMRKGEHWVWNSWGYLCTHLGVNYNTPWAGFLILYVFSWLPILFLSASSLLLSLIWVQFITLLCHSTAFIGLRAKNHLITSKKIYPRKTVWVPISVRASMWATGLEPSEPAQWNARSYSSDESSTLKEMLAHMVLVNAGDHFSPDLGLKIF